MALWTRNCTFVPFGPETDPLFKHQILKQINPYNKPVSSDSCVRTIPYSKIKPALLEDAQKGGAKLMEAFCAGMWGGYGYAIQRRLMRLSKDDSNREDLWEKADIVKSTFEPGTYFTNHFVVLSKSPRSVTLRGCFSPRQFPPGPQDVDTVCELTIVLDDKKRTATLALNSITFNGTKEASEAPDPFGGVAGWLHRQYAKLLVESGADNCTQ
ncbi:hypothetical protein jhhlp_008453 [Lomentospora prolificans]|uniref:Uncharacterized protein n=1 Tax=Lomentospora prolificans TaxID=41688 RepID=A0A2N3MY40_9PEZI|nr:hypothetical protein jhhlp_008453 [Lomentospora prolificans]